MLNFRQTHSALFTFIIDIDNSNDRPFYTIFHPPDYDSSSDFGFWLMAMNLRDSRPTEERHGDVHGRHKKKYSTAVHNADGGKKNSAA